MQNERNFLCSQLVRVSAQHGAEIGNLEEISATRCVVAVERCLPVGTQIRMQCLEGGATEKGAGTESMMRGHVQGAKADPELGYLLEVEFERRPWNEKRWKPAHMIPLNPKQDVLQAPMMMD